DVFSFPAPDGPYGSKLAVFKGTNPNGHWKLFVMNYEGFDTGSINRWSLSITTEETTCCTEHDLLAISLLDAPDPAVAGQPMSYVLKVANVGTSAAHHVIVTNRLPSALSAITFAPGQGTYRLAGEQLVWDVGDLASGAAVTGTIIAIPSTAS